MYVEFMKNFPPADSGELMPFRLISASWAKKPLIPTFETWCTSNSWKIFFWPISASYWLLDSFWPFEPKNLWFLLSNFICKRLSPEWHLGAWSHYILPAHQRMGLTYKLRTNHFLNCRAKLYSVVIHINGTRVKFRNIKYSNRSDLFVQLAEHRTSFAKVVGSIQP